MLRFARLEDGSLFQLPPQMLEGEVTLKHPKAQIEYAPCLCVQERLAKQRFGRLFDASEMPGMYREFSFASWDSMADEAHIGKAEARRIVEDYLVNEGVVVTPNGDWYTGLVLSGTFGIGKTGLAAAAANEYLRQGRTLLWIDFSQFILRVQASYGHEDGPQADQLITAASKAPLLFLDDMGDVASGKPVSDNVRLISYNVINQRYIEGRPTVITTNHDRDNFSRAFGERLASRIRQVCAWIDMSGANLRG